MRGRDDLCLIVNEVRKKHTITHYSCSCNYLMRLRFFLHIACFQQFLVFKFPSDSLAFSVFPANLQFCCSVREDQSVQDFQWNSEGMHRVAYEDAYTRALLDYCRSVLPQSVRKADPDADSYNVSTYQAASSSKTWVPPTGRVNSGKLRILTNRFQIKGSTSPTILTCPFTQNSGRETTSRM